MKKLTLLALGLFFCFCQESTMAQNVGQKGSKYQCTTEDYCTKTFPETKCMPGIHDKNRKWCVKPCGENKPCAKGFKCVEGYCHYTPRRECTSSDSVCTEFPGTQCVPGIKDKNRKWCSTPCEKNNTCARKGFVCVDKFCHPKKWVK